MIFSFFRRLYYILEIILAIAFKKYKLIPMSEFDILFLKDLNQAGKKLMFAILSR